MAIEQSAGRERPYPGAPRTLDLDLILCGPAVIDEPGLVVPHPRFRDRGFVLAPLCQIAPGLRRPRDGPDGGGAVPAPGEEVTPCASPSFSTSRARATRRTSARGLEAVREAAAGGATLVAFPELAFTPFFPCCRCSGPLPLELAETVPGPTTDAFARLAAELGVVIVLNLYEREGGRAFDSSPGHRRRRAPARHHADAARRADAALLRAGVLHARRSRHARVRHGRRADRRGDLLRPALSGGDAQPGPAAGRRGGGAPGRHGGGVAGRSVRSGTSRGGVPERLLHRAGESRGRRAGA